MVAIESGSMLVFIKKFGKQKFRVQRKVGENCKMSKENKVKDV